MSDVAIDSSTLVAYLSGQKAHDTDCVATLLSEKRAFIAPVTLSEILSYPRLTRAQVDAISLFPLLTVEEGYWQRAGDLRRKLLSRGRKAHLPDALIAQSCLDHDVPLLTRDEDFRIFAECCELKMLI